MQSKYCVGLVFLYLNLSGGEFSEAKIPPLRETFTKYITYTLPKPITQDFDDPCNTCHYRLMQEILKEKPNITAVATLIKTSSVEQLDDGMLFSPLMASAVLCQNDILQLLLAKAVKVDQVNRREQSAAMLAALANNTNGLRLLIEAGANLELKDNQGNTALEYARVRKSTDCIKLMS